MTATPALLTARDVFYAHDGGLTLEYYKQLTQHGPVGQLAVTLFRALKRSKKTTGFGFRKVSKRKAERYDYAEAYEWAIGEIIKVMACNSELRHISWGWRDGVLFLELHTGMVCFNCPEQGLAPLCPVRLEPPDGSRDLRIILFCDKLDFESSQASRGPERHVRARQA